MNSAALTVLLEAAPRVPWTAVRALTAAGVAGRHGAWRWRVESGAEALEILYAEALWPWAPDVVLWATNRADCVWSAVPPSVAVAARVAAEGARRLLEIEALIRSTANEPTRLMFRVARKIGRGARSSLPRRVERKFDEWNVEVDSKWKFPQFSTTVWSVTVPPFERS
jgi:hypothetical protein